MACACVVVAGGGGNCCVVIIGGGMSDVVDCCGGCGAVLVDVATCVPVVLSTKRDSI